MTEPASAGTRQVARDGRKEQLPSRGGAWFRTREGRRYGWEIGAILVAKMVLLIILWFAFIKPWPRPATAPAIVVQQLYAPSATVPRHD